MLSCVVASNELKKDAEVLIPSDYMMLPAVKNTYSTQLASHEVTSSSSELSHYNFSQPLPSKPYVQGRHSSPLETNTPQNNSSFDDIAADIVICTIILAFVALTYRDAALSCR